MGIVHTKCEKMFTPLSLDVTLITHKILIGLVRSIKSPPNVQASLGVQKNVFLI